MIITAKFASVCPCCNVRIVAGSKVEWSKGSPAKHVACTGTASAPAASSAVRRNYDPSRFNGYGRGRGGVARRICDGWGADNPHAPRVGCDCGNDD